MPSLARGATRIAQVLLGYARQGPFQVRMALVNGAPGLIVRDSGGVLSVIAPTIDADRITAFDVIRDRTSSPG